MNELLTRRLIIYCLILFLTSSLLLVGIFSFYYIILPLEFSGKYISFKNTYKTKLNLVNENTLLNRDDFKNILENEGFKCTTDIQLTNENNKLIWFETLNNNSTKKENFISTKNFIVCNKIFNQFDCSHTLSIYGELNDDLLIRDIILSNSDKTCL